MLARDNWRFESRVGSHRCRHYVVAVQNRAAALFATFKRLPGWPPKGSAHGVGVVFASRDTIRLMMGCAHTTE